MPADAARPRAPARTRSATVPPRAECPRGTCLWASEQHHLDGGTSRQPAGVERDFEHVVVANQREDQVLFTEDGYSVKAAVGTWLQAHLDVIFAACGRRHVARQPSSQR